MFPRKLQTRQPQIRSAVLTNPRLDTSQTSTSAGGHTRWSGPGGSINGKRAEGKGARGWGVGVGGEAQRNDGNECLDTATSPRPTLNRE